MHKGFSNSFPQSHRLTAWNLIVSLRSKGLSDSFPHSHRPKRMRTQLVLMQPWQWGNNLQLTVVQMLMQEMHGNALSGKSPCESSANVPLKSRLPNLNPAIADFSQPSYLTLFWWLAGLGWVVHESFWNTRKICLKVCCADASSDPTAE